MSVGGDLRVLAFCSIGICRLSAVVSPPGIEEAIMGALGTWGSSTTGEAGSAKNPYSGGDGKEKSSKRDHGVVAVSQCEKRDRK